LSGGFLARSILGGAGLIAAQGAELIHGSEGHALVGGGLTLDFDDGGGGVIAEALAEEIVVILAIAVRCRLVDDGGFDAVCAGHQPLGLGDLLDEEELVLGGGLKVVEVGGEELVEGVLVFGVEDAEAAGESVFERVGGRPGFAAGGLRTGAVLRVGAIGVDLGFGCHNRGIAGRVAVPALTRWFGGAKAV